jgi:Short C-terminal domain/Phospholipase_D-nuclease N-terminal
MERPCEMVHGRTTRGSDAYTLGNAVAWIQAARSALELGDPLFLAADYPFLDILWTMLVFFGWVIWFWLLITVFGDLFSRHDISGWGKAGWIVLVVVLPYLGVFIYLIAQGAHMAERRNQRTQAARTEFDDYVKTVAAPGGAAAEIDKAKQLLDSGAITQAEFDAIKAKALA